MKNLATLYAALATPYTQDDNVDEASLRQLVSFILQQGIEGIYVGGSTGESLLHSTAERQQVIRIVADECQGKARLIGHVGALSTKESKTLAATCAQAGFDAVSAIPPIYYPYSAQDIYRYYQEITQAAEGLGMLVYNIPAMSGVKFSQDHLQQLLSIDGVIGLKQTSLDMYQMEQIRRGFPDALLLNGYDEVFLAGMVSGASGGVGSTYNIMGWRYKKLWQLIEQGNMPEALALQAQCNQVIDLLVQAGVFPGIKFILQQMGIIETAVCRSPFSPVESSYHQALSQVAQQLLAERSHWQ